MTYLLRQNDEGKETFSSNYMSHTHFDMDTKLPNRALEGQLTKSKIIYSGLFGVFEKVKNNVTDFFGVVMRGGG